MFPRVTSNKRNKVLALQIIDAYFSERLLNVTMNTLCAVCWKTFPPGQTMVLDPSRKRTGFGVWSLCMSCFGREPNPMDWVLKKCIHCRRPLFVSIENPPPVIACSDSCRNTARAKERRRIAREKTGTQGCLVCGKQFSPKRTDARVCSNACRQRAYRQRLTVDPHLDAHCQRRV
jgi:hypothetical protein